MTNTSSIQTETGIPTNGVDVATDSRSSHLRRWQQGATTDRTGGGSESRRRAVLYLRVSSKRQVSTDFDPEGISLPAQRLACE